VSAVFGSGRRIQGLAGPEVRVLGCMLEKQRTTPDQYPLSLNALRLACNQSTNRAPIVDYDEATVREALHRLERRGLVRLASGAGSRAAKFRHLLAEALPLDDGEHAVMAVLMLRDTQTPGELKQRSERMHAFADLAAVNQTLQRLIARDLVARLDRRPGQKEERYAQLLGERDTEIRHSDGGSAQAGATTITAGAGEAGSDRQSTGSELAQLRERVSRLEREVADLRSRNSGAMRNPSSQIADDPPSPDPRR
jgi:uncharacterized protein YceH (UPF0502 family)